MNKYLIGNTVRISALFTDAASAAIDPASVSIKIKKPGGSLISETALENPSVGTFYYDYVPDMTGIYYYRFEGTGNMDSAAEGSFEITISSVI